jgi:hypothetical protein
LLPVLPAAASFVFMSPKRQRIPSNEDFCVLTQPLAASQVSSVQTSSSLQSGMPGSVVCVQPETGSQVSVVHELLSLQSVATSWHSPATHALSHRGPHSKGSPPTHGVQDGFATT